MHIADLQRCWTAVEAPSTGASGCNALGLRLLLQDAKQLAISKVWIR